MKLLDYNAAGLVPGPDETEAEFIARAEYCLNLKNTLSPDIGEIDHQLSKQLLEESSKQVKKLYGINPEWVPIVFSNYKLTFWHGGCAWIFQLDDETPIGAFFQLRKHFYKNKNYWIYSRDELIEHESAHVGRMAFNEPKFEEMLAYRSSRSAFRKWLGPIIQAPWEAILFLFLLLMTVFSEFVIPNYLWIKLLPVPLIAIGILRLIWRHRQFDRTLNTLKAMMSEENANAVIYRLTDEEIIAFSHFSKEQIMQYAKQAKSNLRWQIIYHAYFFS